MTLVIATRFKNQVTFSSDSRISLGNDNYFDYGIKIFKVPFNLHGPLTPEKTAKPPSFQYNYGLAVIGSSVNAYTVKDTIAEILGNLQYYFILSDSSILAIADMILPYYRKISEELSLTMRHNSLTEIILAGYCIKKKKIRVLHFLPYKEDGIYKYTYDEILTEDGFRFFGSGKKLAEEIYHKDTSIKPLMIIKKAIEMNNEKSIGGAPQCGGCADDNFEIYGVLDPVLIEDGKIKEAKYYLRGFEINPDQHKDYPYLNISYSYNILD